MIRLICQNEFGSFITILVILSVRNTTKEDITSGFQDDVTKVRCTIPYRHFDPGSVRYDTGVPDGTLGRTERYTLVYQIIFIFSYCSSVTV